MTNWARVEREALCDLFVAVGPDAPTLCVPWTTRDLAAHLILRERRPDAAGGILISALSGYTSKVQHEIARRPWDDLIETVRKGPPGWSPTAIDAVDRFINTVEFFIHHEDVRRAGEAWERRELDAAHDAELWAALKRGGRLMARRAGVGVEVSRPDGEDARLRAGTPSVTVSGPPGEILMFMSGRQGHARVGLVGPHDAVEKLRSARLGL